MTQSAKPDSHPAPAQVLRSCRIALIALCAVLALAALVVTEASAQQAAAGTPTATATPAAALDAAVQESDQTKGNAGAGTAAPGNPTQQPAGNSGEQAADDAEPEVDPHFLTPLVRRPYRTHVAVAFSGRQFVSTAVRENVVREVSAAVSRVWGRMLQAQVSENDWLLPGTVGFLKRVTSADVLDRYPEAQFDKVLLVAVQESTGVIHVACREYDPRIQELTAVREELLLDPRGIGDAAGRVMRDSFRPVLFLDTPNPGSDELELLLQAGDIVPPDPEAAQIRKGDVLRTFMRHMERRDPLKLRTLQPLDLTYVRVTDFNQDLSVPADGGSAEQELPVVVAGTEPDDAATYVDRARVHGVLISHLPVAPFGQRGRAVQQMAVRQRPAALRSSVQLVLNNRADRPLVCYRVDKVAKLRWREESEVPSVRMVTDRQGRIDIDVDPDHPTFWLYVYSGALLLARVPYAPGLIPEDTIRLPDDSLRLGVEGELYLFRDQLVDVVARRAVYKSLAKKAAAAGDMQQLEGAIQQLDGLPGKRDFDAALNAVETPAIRRADEMRNASAKRKVQKLCQAMAESLEEFFKTEKQVRELEDIQKLRETARSRNPTTEQP